MFKIVVIITRMSFKRIVKNIKAKGPRPYYQSASTVYRRPMGHIAHLRNSSNQKEAFIML